MAFRQFYIPIETPVKGGVEVEEILFIEKSAFDEVLAALKECASFLGNLTPKSSLPNMALYEKVFSICNKHKKVD